MDKSQKLILVLGILVASALAIYSLIPTSKKLGAFTTSPCRSADATTTLRYLTTSTASTTLDCETSQADVIGVFGQLVSSSSATMLHCAVGYSYDNIDYFWETAKQVNANGQILLVGSSTRRFLPSFAGHGGQTQATSTFYDELTPVAAKYTRYECNVSGASGGLWFMMSKRESF